jgi:hypothetical protein
MEMSLLGLVAFMRPPIEPPLLKTAARGEGRIARLGATTALSVS